MVFNKLGTEILRIDHSGAVGIGSAPVCAWTSQQDPLGHWTVGTHDLNIGSWLERAGAQQDELGHWICGPEIYTMFLLRWAE